MSGFNPDADDYVRASLGEYSVAELRRVAQDWHSGQWSALYAFASSGTVIAGLAREANQCATRADASDDAGVEQADQLRAIASLETE